METAERTALLSLLTNLLLVAIKAALVMASGSLAIKADAIHSLSDVVASLIIFIGIRLSGRSAPGFPYGLYKLENLVALATSLLIFYAGYEICFEIFTGAHRALNRIPLAGVGIAATICITWFFSRYELKKGKETGSPSLIADARHIWTDMLSSLVILSGLAGNALGLAVDKYAALVVVVFIGRSAITIFLDAIRVLLDASLDYPTLNRIREIIMEDPRVEELNEIWARNAGRYKFVELDLTVNVSDLAKGHQLSQELVTRIRKEIANVDRVLIHSQPRRREQLTLGAPLADDRSSISAHLGEAPFFRLVTIDSRHGTLLAEHLLANPFLGEAKGKGIKVARWLLQHRLDVLITRHSQAGKGPSYVFGDAGVEVLVTTADDWPAALAGTLVELAIPSANAQGEAEGPQGISREGE